MPLPIKTPIPHLLFGVFLILATANTTLSETTSFAYDFGNGNFPFGLSYLRDAHFAPETNYLRLIKTGNNSDALPDSIGQVFNIALIPLWDSGKVSDFETTVKFIINPNANDNHPADGLTFFMGPIYSTWPPIRDGGHFGIFDQDGKRPCYFAVEFDIYANEWDPPYPHVGIDIESSKSAATTQISNDFLGEMVTMRVNYVAATKMISAVVAWGGKRYEVSYEYDLTTFLPQTVVVGLTASTGANVAIHDVVSWYLTSNLNAIREVVWN